MKVLVSVLTVFFSISSVFAQVAPDKYWVKFTDKSNSPYSVDNPLEFLSQRALDRRAAHQVAVVEGDLPVNPAYVAGVAATGATVLNTSRWFNSVTVFTTSQAVVDAINNLPYVQGVYKSGDYNPDIQDITTQKPFFELEEYLVSPPPHMKLQQHVSLYDYGSGYNQINMLKGDELHNLGYTGAGMVIAVLDAGFTNANNLAAFDSVWNNGQVLGYKDFVSPQNPNIFDSHFHGTAVWSTMAANLQGEMVGTAPGASYWLLRTEDAATENIIEELNWVTAAEFADSAGADIINSSLGYTTMDDPAWSHTYEDMDGNTTPITIGADMAASKGVIVVNSAGNSGSSSWLYIGAPADGDSVFSIGAVDADGNYAAFSSIGPTFDGRLKPNVVAQGQGSAYISPNSGSVTFGNGTSFSSPIMAGLVACLWQANPEVRNTDIMLAIEQSGSVYSSPTYLIGHGIPDFAMANSILTVIEPDKIQTENLLVFPNPFAERITVKTKDAANIVSVTLVDLDGRELNRLSVNHPEAVLSGLESLEKGIYFLLVETEKGILPVKSIKK